MTISSDQISYPSKDLSAMLIIRKEQKAVLQEYMFERFVRQTILHLRFRFPKQIVDKSDEELRVFVHQGLERAKHYEIIREYDIRRYLEYMMIYGMDFDTDPQRVWAGAILRMAKLSGSEKMNRIDDTEMSSNMSERP